jgi:ketosteroid isomerase-like protein
MAAMTHEQIQDWLDAYVAAWRSYDRDAIEALFAEDAGYAYHPYDEPLTGRDAIAASWLENRDEPGTWEASYAPSLVAGDRAIAVGETRYSDGNVFSNLFELDFDADGRCTRFVEWYLHHPRNGNGSG